MGDSLDLVDGDSFEAKNVDQISQFMQPILRGAVRDKLRDISDGNTLINYPLAWIETFSTSTGDDSTVDSGNTDANYDAGGNYWEGLLAKFDVTLDDFEDGTIDSNIWTTNSNSSRSGISSNSEPTNSNDNISESGGDLNLDIDGYATGGGSFSASFSASGNLTSTDQAKIGFYLNQAQVRTDGFKEDQTGYTNADATARIILRDESGGSDQTLLSKTASHDSGDNDDNLNPGDNADFKTGLWIIREASNGDAELVDPDNNVRGTVNNFPNDASVKFTADINGSADDIDVSNDSEADVHWDVEYVKFDDTVFTTGAVQTTTIISASSNITQVYPHSMATTPTGSDVTVDVSVDGGSNFDITDASPDEIIETANVANPGSDLVLRWKTNPTTDGFQTAQFENYGVKVWTI